MATRSEYAPDVEIAATTNDGPLPSRLIVRNHCELIGKALVVRFETSDGTVALGGTHALVTRPLGGHDFYPAGQSVQLIIRTLGDGTIGGDYDANGAVLMYVALPESECANADDLGGGGAREGAGDPSDRDGGDADGSDGGEADASGSKSSTIEARPPRHERRPRHRRGGAAARGQGCAPDRLLHEHRNAQRKIRLLGTPFGISGKKKSPFGM